MTKEEAYSEGIGENTLGNFVPHVGQDAYTELDIKSPR